MDTQAKTGIWQFSSLLPNIEKRYRITLGEGNTDIVGQDNVTFKLEYLNPTGSVKDRALAVQVSNLVQKGIKEAVVSSSGNAAISAIQYCHKAGIKLTIFVSNKINTQKLLKLQAGGARIITDKRPVSAASQYARQHQCVNLRQSKDDFAIWGYKTISYEIKQQVPNIDAIFIPVSTGTILTGVARGFKELGHPVSIHAVQSEAVHLIASEFDKQFTLAARSLADSLVAKYSPRFDEVIGIIKSTGGFGWVINDQQIVSARQWLLSHNINCGYEGSAVLAAYWKAKENGYSFKNPVCLLTGSFYES